MTKWSRALFNQHHKNSCELESPLGYFLANLFLVNCTANDREFCCLIITTSVSCRELQEVKSTAGQMY